MTERIPIPRPLAGRAFTVEDARRQGLSKARLRSTDLASPFWGVRAAAPPKDAADAALTYAPRLGDGHVLGGRSAAALHGLPYAFEPGPPREVTIVLAKGTSRPTARGVMPREVRPDLLAWEVVHGVRVTTPVLTWCVAARDCTVAELVRMGDALVSTKEFVGRRPGFEPVGLLDLADAVEAWHGCTGVAKLREAFAWVRLGVASPPETDMRLAVIDAGVPEFEVNAEIWTPQGEFVACVDGLVRDVGLVFEYEGDGHRTSQAQFRKDIRRYDLFGQLDYTVVRATSDDLYKMREEYQRRVVSAHARAVARAVARAA